MPHFLTLAIVAMTPSAGEPDYVRTRALHHAIAVSLLTDSDAEAAILLSILRSESRWLPSAAGPRGACGSGQIEQPGLWRSTCEAMAASVLESVRVARDVLRYGKTHCGSSYEDALTMYVSGVCGLARSAARDRCAPVALCSERT